MDDLLHQATALPQHPMGRVAPKLAEISEQVLFGDIWERSALSKRDRSLATVAALISLYRLEQLPFHFEKALENGVTHEELSELVTHLAFYAGWPAAASACTLMDSTLKR